jgi:hypothetical protein
LANWPHSSNGAIGKGGKRLIVLRKGFCWKNGELSIWLSATSWDHPSFAKNLDRKKPTNKKEIISGRLI